MYTTESGKGHGKKSKASIKKYEIITKKSRGNDVIVKKDGRGTNRFSGHGPSAQELNGIFFFLMSLTGLHTHGGTTHFTVKSKFIGVSGMERFDLQ